MWSRESPMKEYARKHPGCSLQEYCEYLDNIAREEAERRRLKEEENNQLLKSFEGKCFKIDFNGMSTMFFRLTSDPTDPRSSRIEEDAYSVYIDSSKVHMELEKKRYIDVMWLPGQEEWYGNSHKVFQISEEDFNKVVEKYNEMVKVAKEIKAT
jgi:hypothetical protein